MIRQAKSDDRDRIMRFIDINWKKNHILSINKDFFLYEFLHEKKLNLYLSEDSHSEIEAIQGFIPYDSNYETVFLVMLRSISTDNPFLGYQLIRRIIDEMKPEIIASVGINMHTMPYIFKRLGFKIGKLNQWYRLGNKNTYDIAKINNSLIPYVEKYNCNLIKFEHIYELTDNFDFLNYKHSLPKPFKSLDYIKKRYFNNPIYKYKVYGIKRNSDICRTIIVFRIQKYKESYAIRLVDVIGDFNRVYEITSLIDNLLLEYNAEYVDFYEKGLNKDKMLDAGWLLTAGSNNIIPNYFSPFVMENIDIYYTTNDESITLFKADGDQDRPS
jgi:hypothetical protein